MENKRIQIIRTAIKLFAEKGYHATSIQEIADSLGIAKGSVYSYFKSKQDLLFSVLSYYSDLFDFKLSSVMKDASLSPKMRLATQLQLMFQEFRQHKDFIMMQMKDLSYKELGDAGEFFKQMKIKTSLWYLNSIRMVYGKEVESYEMDISSILEGIVAEYLRIYIMEEQDFELPAISAFIIERLDDIVSGLLKRRPQPVLNTRWMEQAMNRLDGDSLSWPDRILSDISSLQTSLDANDPDTAEITSSLQVIQEEFNTGNPRLLVVKGMVSILRNKHRQELDALCADLEYLIRLEE